MLSRVPTLSLAIAAVLAAQPVAATASTTPSSEQITLADLAQRLQALEQRLSAGNNQSPDSARAEVAELQQRLAVLERKLELQQEDATAKATSAPAVAVNDKGLSVRSADGNYEIKLRGTVQADHRVFFGDDDIPQNDTFLFRRIRPTLEGSLGPLIGFRLTPEFAGDSATIVDAYVDVKFDPRYTLRVGKLKGPVGLERLQSASAISFIERGFATELAPNRDIGAQLQGELAKGRVNYAIGIFNGAPDGRDAPTSDADDNFEFAGRVFFEPWKNDANALSGLGFGLSASTGDKSGLGNNFLPRYRSPGQSVFFNYRSTVAADGEHTRISPHFYYYRNAFGLLGEYIRSEQDVWVSGNAATHTSLTHSAWNLTGSWVLTGEDAGYRGVVKPARSFLAGGEGWGAFELVARYGELDIDDDAFPIYANADSAASRSRAWGIGLNWYLTSNLKLVFNHTRATFDGGAPLGADREDEKTFFSRVQVAF
ncbi:porin [Arenimonas sp.]|uniref:porin n=1 Tax=Arenimonas sp. TaxID=1872635 RepID=UPI0039E616E4